jgi:hypothetical protein
MAVALPLLALGPFLWRRIRGGVRVELEKRQRFLNGPSK